MAGFPLTVALVRSASATREPVLRVVLYYDVFRHALHVAEVARLVGAPVEEAVDGLVAEGVLERVGPWVCLAGSRAHVARRRERGAAAERRWAAARGAAATLARFPWVRGVFVTGSLSKLSAEEGGDVDFLLLCAPGSVWTAKSSLHVLRRGVPEAVRNLYCTNYLLDVEHPLVDDRNAFTAMELATAVPMAGGAACAGFLRANAWAEGFVPGYAWSIERAERAPELPRRRIAGWVEAVGKPVRGPLERASIGLWSRFWDTKYSWLPAQDRAQRFKRRPEIATNHLHDFQDYVLREYRRRLDAHGLDGP